MVSKASDDFPDPLNPVMTVSVFRGISTSIFFRLCCRAPCTVMRSNIGLVLVRFSGNAPSPRVEHYRLRAISLVLLFSLCLCPLGKLRYNQHEMKCGQCGGKLRRVHRTFWERFSYMAIYECRQCEREEFAPRRYRYHMGTNTRCPVCG